MSETELPTVPDDLAELFAPELNPGERLLWAGRPRPWRAARDNRGSILFGVILLGLGVAWTVVVWMITRAGNGPPVDSLPYWLPFFSVITLPAGIVTILQPFQLARQARRSAYAVTDQRLLGREPQHGGSIRVSSEWLRRISDITRSEYPDGGGRLEFVIRPDPNEARYGREIRFADVDNVLAVQQLIRREIAKAVSHGS